MAPIKVLVVDDHTLFHEGLGALLTMLEDDEWQSRHHPHGG